MIAEFFGGPYDGGAYRLEVVEAPPALTFAAARAVVGWDVASISETTYALADGDVDGVARYELVRR